MEPEQERLSKLYSGSGIHSLPELNPKLNPKSPSYLKPMIHRSASFPHYIPTGFAFSRALSHTSAHASLGILQSPLGDSATVPTFGPSGRQERLNCWMKNRLQNVYNHL